MTPSKIIILIGSALLLAAACNKQPNISLQANKDNRSTLIDCELNRSQMVDYLKAMDSKAKEQVSELVSTSSEIKEIFYSSKQKNCVYIARTDKTWKSISPNASLTLRDGATGSVLVAELLFPERSDYGDKINHFNSEVQAYR